MPDSNKKKWYLRKELYGAIITSITPTLLLFPQHTIAFKVGVSLNALAGGVLTYLGVVRGNSAKNLPGQANGVHFPEGIRDKIKEVKQSLASKKTNNKQ
jgi:hypothetical protein